MDVISGLNLVLVILGFGLLILVHELGHYLAARWAGIRTDNFSIGMGPALLSWRRGLGFRLGSGRNELCKRFDAARTVDISDEALASAGLGETEWTLRAIPVGGFVQMLGQDDAKPSQKALGHPRSYRSAPIGKRMVVISAGVFMNGVLGLLLFMIAFMAGVGAEAPWVGGVQPGSPAERAGIMAGDRVESIDGKPTTTFTDITLGCALHVGADPLRVVVARTRGDTTEHLTFVPIPEFSDTAGVRVIGVSPAVGDQLATDRESLPLLRDAMLEAGFFDRDRVAGAPDDWFTAGASESEFAARWRGARLVQVNGVDAQSALQLGEQAQCAPHEPVRSTWSLPWGDAPTPYTIHVDLDPVAALDALAYPDSAGRGMLPLERGLAGMVPLVLVRATLPGSINDDAFQPGDAVLAVGDTNAPRMDEFRGMIADRAGQIVPLTVWRDGAATGINVRVDGTGRLGVLIGYALDVPCMATPMAEIMHDGSIESTPAASSGLPGRTWFDTLDGAPVRSWGELQAALIAKANAGADSVELGVRLPEQPDAVRIVRLPLDQSQRAQLAHAAWVSPLGSEWFDLKMVTLHAGGNPLRAIGMGFAESKKLAIMTWLTIDRLVRGTVAVKQLRGPIGIVHIGTRVADRGWTYLVFFLAVLSVNLAVLNFLPLPIADGGHMCYLVYERVTGREPSEGFQAIAFLVGLLIFASLFLVTFYNDIARLLTA